MTKVLVIADAHIKDRTWTNNVSVRGDAEWALGILKQHAYDEKTSHVILAGDTFDSNRPSSDDVLTLKTTVGSMRDLYYIRGNHDSTEPAWVKVSCMHAQHLEHDEPVYIDGLAVFGMDYTSTHEETLGQLEVMASYCREHDIRECLIIMHTGIREFLGHDGTYTAELADFVPIFDGIEATVIAGHVHRRGTVSRGSVTVHSPGSIYPLSVDEMLTPCCATMVDIDGGKVSLRSIEVETRKWVRIGYDGNELELRSTLAKLDKAEGVENTGLRPTYVRVELQEGQDVPDIRTKRIVVQFARQGEQHESEAVQSAHADTVEDAIRQAAGDDTDCAAMAVELFNSDDPLKTLHYWVDFWGATWAGK